MHKLSTASQLSLLAVVILMGAVFFTVNSALQEQQSGSHASSTSAITVTTPSCIANGYIGSGVKIYWTYPGIKGVDISSNSSFSTLYHKTVNGNSSAATIGFSRNISGTGPVNLTLNPGHVYYVRTWNGSTHSPITKFVVPSCSPKVTLKPRPTCTPRPVCKPGFCTLPLPPPGGWCPTGPTITLAPTCAPPPQCFQHGVMICTIPFGGWCHVTPKPTCTPPPPCLFTTPRCMITVPVGGWCRVTPTPTCTPRPVCKPGFCTLPLPPPGGWCPTGPTVTPAPTFVPGSTLLSFTVGLHGIGTAGDSANPNSTGNMDPLHPTRVITVQVYDVQNQLVASQEGTILYNKTTGKFNGTVNLGSSFATGLYTVKVKTDQYLRALVPGIQTITAGKTNTLPLVTLIAGDINGDNVINIIDYNILIGCYSDLLPATNCSATNKVLSDLNDDGQVNMYDYNLFLRELTNIGGQ